MRFLRYRTDLELHGQYRHSPHVNPFQSRPDTLSYEYLTQQMHTHAQLLVPRNYLQSHSLDHTLEKSCED